MIYNQIIQVFDVAEAIKENGVQNYIHRLVQDSLGDYFYVDYKTMPEKPEGEGLLLEKIVVSDGSGAEELGWILYEITKIPRDIAFYIIDTMKLKSQIMEIGQGARSGDGAHGGTRRFYVWNDGKIRQISEDEVRVVVVEDL